jgi:hypothetical protein
MSVFAKASWSVKLPLSETGSRYLPVDKQRGNARQAHRAGEVVRALRLQLDAEGTVGVLELRAIDPLPRNPVRDAGFHRSAACAPVYRPEEGIVKPRHGLQDRQRVERLSGRIPGLMANRDCCPVSPDL